MVFSKKKTKLFREKKHGKKDQNSILNNDITYNKITHS